MKWNAVVHSYSFQETVDFGIFHFTNNLIQTSKFLIQAIEMENVFLLWSKIWVMI